VPSASLIDRRVLDEIGYFESRFDGVEDRELWSRLIQRYDIAHVEALVTLYRKHDQQITLNTPLRQIANDRLVSRFFNSLPLTSWFPNADDDRTMAESLSRLARALLGSRYPTVESALQLLRLAQSRHFDPEREPLISRLESDFRKRCEAKNGSQNGHS
jgi:hypothetical protein